MYYESNDFWETADSDTLKQIAHITLNTIDMCMTIKPFSGLFQHIDTVIKTGYVCIFHGNPFLCREYSRSNWNIKKIS